ncbi:RNA polymerase sigma factor [Euzebya tangerina]|uniref:RNA polymerase sigma factor n=1 Tax=Euzebya tangerina TaxID=591198 RepID=UPI0013C2F904|nr:sigma-70 family RNA polymerase sigma factor [Euzebya tangerina]
MDTRAWEDNVALSAFCQAIHPKIRSALLLQTGDAALADDLSQETLCRVIERWDSVMMMESPEGWAFTVAFNLSRSWWRRVASRRRAVDRITRDSREVDEPDPSVVPWVRDAIAALPPRQREVIVLRYYADLDVAETAEAMGCAPGTVKSLSSKARTALSAALAVEDDPQPSRVRGRGLTSGGTVDGVGTTGPGGLR